METVNVKRISEERFNAYVSLTRHPIAAKISQEIEWYASQDDNILGVVIFDYSDKDYNAIILGRDEVGRFRAIDLSISYEKYEDAENWLVNSIKWLSGQNKKVFPQGDPAKTCDIFRELVPIEKQHPYFAALNTQKSLLAAKELIQQIMPHFIDIDGNFVEQFQTTGFDQRLWELYLYCYFNEEGLSIDRTKNAPDFIVSDGINDAAIESVIVGRKTTPSYFVFDPKQIAKRPTEEDLKNNMPLKFGSPLYTKLTHVDKEGKHYWDLPHVMGKPFCIAIHDFHENHSMTWSHNALITYLYGFDHDYEYKEGSLVIKPVKIEAYYKNGKEIPSGFFFQADSENISAIITSSIGTISKFNRLGRQAGFGDKDIVMIRYGSCYNKDPNASKPLLFKYEVTEESKESWGEGVSIYHNPNATIPLPREIFPNAAHHYFDDGQIISYMPEFFPYNSETVNLIRNNG